jgi:hypothetical protein
LRGRPSWRRLWPGCAGGRRRPTWTAGLGAASVTGMPGAGTSNPVVAPTGVVHGWVQLDGIHLSGGWPALIALGPAGVIAWQWCDTEKTAAWTALLAQVPAPDAVVVDGGPGLLAALRATRPATRVQRCLVHVQRDVRRHLTIRPSTPSGRACGR